MEALTVLVVVLGQHPPTEYITPESISPGSSAAPPGKYMSQIRLGPIRNSQSMAARAPEVVPCTKVQYYSAPGPHVTQKAQTELAYIDILVNLKIRLDSVKRMTQIQNTS